MHNGSSSVDYCIHVINCEMLNSIAYLQVHNYFLELSDHNLISCLLKRIVYTVECDNKLKLTTPPGRIK